MNDRYKKYIDGIINDVNNITDQQLLTIGLEYMKCKRVDKFLFMLSKFTSEFFTRMHEIHTSVEHINLPMNVFRCGVVLILDLETNRYVTHRLYTFPNKIELFNLYSIHDEFTNIDEQIKEKGMNFNVNLLFSISSRTFDSTRIERDEYDILRSVRFQIDGSISRLFNFDIDYFIDNYVEYVGKSISFRDPYYRKIKLSKEEIISAVECTCVKTGTELPYICNCTDLKECSRYHARKCRCGYYTYYRTDTCIKCHLTYTRSKRIQSRLGMKVEGFTNNTIFVNHTITAYLPYLHYNQSNGGLCLGSGGQVINQMIENNINPLRLMLSFKVNLAYSDAEESNRYYMKYKNRIRTRDFKKNFEYNQVLQSVFRNQRIKINTHTFSLHCFCRQCLFLKIVVFITNRLFHKDLFTFSNSYIVSRDKFIELYKRYLTRTISKTYSSSYIHKMIKQVINLQPNQFFVTE